METLYVFIHLEIIFFQILHNNIHQNIPQIPLYLQYNVLKSYVRILYTQHKSIHQWASSSELHDRKSRRKQRWCCYWGSHTSLMDNTKTSSTESFSDSASCKGAVRMIVDRFAVSSFGTPRWATKPTDSPLILVLRTDIPHTSKINDALFTTRAFCKRVWTMWDRLFLAYLTIVFICTRKKIFINIAIDIQYIPSITKLTLDWGTSPPIHQK